MKFETTIQTVIQRNPSIISLRFSRPEGLEYKPGQFFYITLRFMDKELSHHFSFSSSPTQQYIEFTKKLSESEFSAALRAAKPGDWAKIEAPYGKFTFEGEHPKIALLGGGIGVTPLISISQYATDKGLGSKIVMFYACRTPEDAVFKKEFEALTKRNPNLKVTYVMSQPSQDWAGLKGYITADLVKKQLPDFADYVFYSCGPPPMVKAMQQLVEQLGLPKEQFKMEYFSGYSQA
jgi:ferredoxin-NADP reductase